MSESVRERVCVSTYTHLYVHTLTLWHAPVRSGMVEEAHTHTPIHTHTYYIHTLTLWHAPVRSGMVEEADPMLMMQL